MTFFFTILFMFLVFWRPQEWLVPWLFGWPLLDVVVAMSLLSLIIEVDEGRVVFPKDRPQVYMLAGLWFAAIMSHVAHTYFAGVTKTAPDVFKICFFTLLLYSCLDRPSRLRAVAGCFVSVAAVMAVHSILQERRGYGFVGLEPMWIWVPDGDEWRCYSRSLFFGIFNDPNDMGQFLITAIPLAFAIPRRLMPIGWIGPAAVSYLLYQGYDATHSRGAGIGLAAFFAVVLLFLLPPRTARVMAGVYLLAALVLCATQGGRLLDESAHDRVVFWGYGNWAFKKNPLFGIGYGMFPEIANDRPAHNAFVSCYTELGLFGYWFWFGLLYLGVVGSWQVREVLRGADDAERRYLRRFASLTVAALASFAASSYFLSRTFIYPLFFLMALANGVPRACERQFGPGSYARMETRRSLLLYGTAATLLSVVFVYVSILFLNRAYGG